MSAVAALPTYIPLTEAARRYGLSEAALRRAVEKGIIRAVRTPRGEILVVNEAVTQVKEHIARREQLWKQVSHLDGHPIGIREACEKYRLDVSSIYRWIDKGYVRVLSRGNKGGGRGRKRTLNEADVAYISLVADLRGRKQGKKIVTTEFIPPHLN